jgi:FlaA1/EpsC-like NDP-sugar epimerase
MKRNRKLKVVRIIALILCDIVAVNLALYLAYYLRFDHVSAANLAFIMRHAPVITLISLVVFYFFRLYTSVWRYASTGELVQVIAAAFFSTALMVSYFIAFQITVPRSVYVFWGILTMLFTGGLRMSYRLLRYLSVRMRRPKVPIRRVMIIGAGDAGAVVIRELKNHSQLNSLPVVAIDDNVTKRGTYINHVPVVGTRKDIVKMAKQHKIDEIIIAIPSAGQHEIREIVGECQKTDCEIKTLPGIYELIDGRIDIHAIRKVKIEDLLGRDEIQLDRQQAGRIITGKTVLVTGAGGSIGSELVRQLALYRPNELVLFDFYENSVYDLQNELSRKFSVQYYNNGYAAIGNFDFRLRVFIGSVRDQQRVHEVLHETRPDLIFHAAAHKHVPLMEGNPKEAVKNNVFGTFNVAKAAIEHRVRRFVLISTDKAVNPTNIMGATKRLCEMIIQALSHNSETVFSLVRFGNVLGSNGSVVPLFEKQIAEQGYVTVTHPEIIRYFMTIPEAARLVIQASAMSRGGEIFILDMGQPVKIADLARDVIRLSGYEPDVDIPIRYTGLRPGEKLYEELLMDEEGLQPTADKKIFIGRSIDIDYQELMTSLDRLEKLLVEGSDDEIRNQMQQLVPTYNPFVIFDDSVETAVMS